MLYVSLDEMDAHRGPVESDAEVLLRSVRFAQDVAEGDGRVRPLARAILRHAGLPDDDPLGLELALALAVRARFLAELPHLRFAQTDPDGEAREA